MEDEVKKKKSNLEVINRTCIFLPLHKLQSGTLISLAYSNFIPMKTIKKVKIHNEYKEIKKLLRRMERQPRILMEN